jgi:hypothetical protein
LGKYIQDLDSKDLNVSLWNGDIKLNNVKLRTDIFQQFKLPLGLVCGQIGNLKISVPLSSIGSKPVDILIENVFLVVSKSMVIPKFLIEPITDWNKWDLPDSSHNFELKEEALNAFAY